jgi:beta-lactamase class A
MRSHVGLVVVLVGAFAGLGRARAEPASPASLVTMQPSAAAAADFKAKVAAVEAKMRGRLGVFAARGPGGLGYRSDERFAYCSTFKWVLAAAVLRQVEAGKLALEQDVRYGKKDLTPFSPVTTKHVGVGKLSVGELCAATVGVSDNAAANLLEPLVGGRAGLTTFVRGMGDQATRFDRGEPELNDNAPGDPRDTTTPEAMARLLSEAFSGDRLSRSSRDHLGAWMAATSTGDHRIRAGVPAGWRIGDKTGTGDHGAANDVAFLMPPTGATIFLAVFTDGEATDRAAHEAAIAEVARLVVAAFP